MLLPELKQKRSSDQTHFDELAPKAVVAKRVFICGVEVTQDKEMCSPSLEAFKRQQGVCQENIAFEATGYGMRYRINSCS